MVRPPQWLTAATAIAPLRGLWEEPPDQDAHHRAACTDQPVGQEAHRGKLPTDTSDPARLTLDAVEADHSWSPTLGADRGRSWLWLTCSRWGWVRSGVDDLEHTAVPEEAVVSRVAVRL